jgi:F0F1-type ATP synthase beta subunit
VAEYFRDVEGQDVLLFVDNIFRFTQARLSSDVCCVPLVLVYDLQRCADESALLVC